MNDDLFQDRHVRWWIASQYVAFVAWAAIISITAVLRLDTVVVLVVGLGIIVVGSWLVSPSRSWWGPGPSQVMADPKALRRYRLWAGLGFVLALGLVPLLIAIVVGQLVMARY